MDTESDPMNNNASYTIEEVSQLLRISKLTVYDLIKKGQLSAYRVGRQMRVDQEDLERYKSNSKTGTTPEISTIHKTGKITDVEKSQIIISGQDIVLDMLTKFIEKQMTQTPLRLYDGSLNSLISMYNGECDIVSVHLFDGDTGEYNLPYVKRILVGQPFILINLVCRTAGIYVQPGNPLQMESWADLSNPNITLVNREKGSGARVLLDEQLRINKIHPPSIKGYYEELTSHLSVASAVASGHADVGIGIENIARMVNVDFIPLVEEHYDLVVLKTKENLKFVNMIKDSINSPEFKAQLMQLNGYNLQFTGHVKYESY